MGKADLAQRPGARTETPPAGARDGSAPGLSAIAATLAGAPTVQRLAKTARGLQTPPSPNGPQSQQPVQRLVAINYTPAVDGAEHPSFSSVMHDGLMNYGCDINWVLPAVRAQALIKQVKDDFLKEPGLDPEEKTEIKTIISQFETSLDEAITTANKRVEVFDGPSNKAFLSKGLAESRRTIQRLAAEIKAMFKHGAGGFSAVGRATEMSELAVHENHGGDEAGDNHYLSTITLGGVTLGGRDKVLGTRIGPVSGAISLRVGGRLYLQTARPPQTYEDGLWPAQGSTQTNATRFTARGRGDGQEAAMGRTNARGYAWATGTAGWDTTPWEWLHIRGAALGGSTTAKNLVLGVRDSNTHMMPFEANLRQLADLAGANPKLYSGLDVTWSIGGKGKTNHIYDTITIDWELKKTDKAPEELVAPEGSAVFAPLKHDTVLSKGEVRYLQSQLRKVREAALPPPKDVLPRVGIKREGDDERDEWDEGEEHKSKARKSEFTSTVHGEGDPTQTGTFPTDMRDD